MSQRKRADENKLEQLENMLGRRAVSRKLLEILTVKVGLIPNSQVRETALKDIEEIKRLLKDEQDVVKAVIEQLEL